MKLYILLLAVAAAMCEAFTGYDCGRGTPNITTVSLIEVGECTINNADPSVHPTTIQLLQRVKHREIFARSCRVLIRQHIRICGMFSHASDVPEGESTFLKQMTREECADIARYGGFRYGQAVVAGVRVNQTTRASATVVGALDDNGACQGALFVWHGHEYPEAVVTVDLEVTVREFSASLDMDEREIKLPAGVTCPYASGHCADEEIGYAFWEVGNSHECDFERYETLFHGDGVKVSDNTTSAPDIYFANSTGNVQFGLAAVGVDQVCGHRLIRTENARLFIVEAPQGHGIKAKTQLDVQNILLADYFNTKLTYYARHVKTQFTSMYKDIIVHRCELERQVIKNSLAQVHTAPDEFAAIVMGQLGYTAVPAGEVIHILQCEPRVCRVRSTEQCFLELPVSCGEVELYLRPKTHILTGRGTPTECNGLIPVMYRLNGIWRQHLPKMTMAKEPQILRPMTRITWSYQNLQNLMNDGIYAPEDLARLHEHAMFPMERAAIVEHVVRRLAGKEAPNEAVQLRNLLDQESVKAMAKSAIGDIWSGFTQFGIYSAGVIAIVVIGQLIKSTIEVIIRGYTLHQLYGWSRRLFGALFSSVTHLFARGAPERADDRVAIPLQQGIFAPFRQENEPAGEDLQARNLQRIRHFLRERQEEEGRAVAPRNNEP